MNKLELLDEIQSKSFIHKIIGIEKVNDMPDGTKVYHCNILEVLGNVGIGRTIPFYVIDEGSEIEIALYQGEEPKPTIG